MMTHSIHVARQCYQHIGGVADTVAKFQKIHQMSSELTAEPIPKEPIRFSQERKRKRSEGILKLQLACQSHLQGVFDGYG